MLWHQTLFMEFEITQKACIKDKAKPMLSCGTVYCNSCRDPELQWLLVKAGRLADISRDYKYSVFHLPTINDGTDPKPPQKNCRACVLLPTALTCPEQVRPTFNPTNTHTFAHPAQQAPFNCCAPSALPKPNFILVPCLGRGARHVAMIYAVYIQWP